MRPYILTIVAVLLYWTPTFGQQSKIDQITKEINFKLKVQSADQGRMEVQADDEGNIILNKTFALTEDKPNFKIITAFNFSEIYMVVKGVPNTNLYCLYFWCNNEKCIRFENDYGETRLDNYTDLLFGKKENADKMKELFIKLKTITKK